MEDPPARLHMRLGQPTDEQAMQIWHYALGF
jgi:hypothetical protein